MHEFEGNMSERPALPHSNRTSMTIDGNRLIAANGSILSFGFKIAEVVEVSGIWIVRLDVPPGCVLTENIFGVTAEGRHVWTIEATEANSTDSTNTYTALSKHDEDVFHAFNWNGTDTAIDVRSGEILETRITK